MKPEILRIILCKECCIYIIYLTDLTAVYNLFQGLNIRTVKISECFCKYTVILFSCGKHFPQLCFIHCNRLLTEYMLSGIQSFYHPFEMYIVRKRNINRFNFRVSKKCVISFIRFHKTEAFFELFSLLYTSSGYCIEFTPFCFFHSRNRTTGSYSCSSENSPFNIIKHIITSSILNTTAGYASENLSSEANLLIIISRFSIPNIYLI